MFGICDAGRRCNDVTKLFRGISIVSMITLKFDGMSCTLIVCFVPLTFHEQTNELIQLAVLEDWAVQFKLTRTYSVRGGTWMKCWVSG